MAKSILAFDKSGWAVTQEQAESIILSGLDGIKITAAGLFNTVYEKIQMLYITKNYPKKFDVFMDLKIADISFGDNQGTNYKIVESVATSPVCPITHISVHGFANRTVREAVAGAGDKLKVLTLCALTDESYDGAYNIDREGSIAAYETAIGARDSGSYGLILPSNNLDYISHGIQNLGMPIWSPGFGRQNKQGNIYEQLKAWRDLVGDNPENAAIIGTHLLDSPNLVEEVRKLKKLIV